MLNSQFLQIGPKTVLMILVLKNNKTFLSVESGHQVFGPFRQANCITWWYSSRFPFLTGGVMIASGFGGLLMRKYNSLKLLALSHHCWWYFKTHSMLKAPIVITGSVVFQWAFGFRVYTNGSTTYLFILENA